MITTTPFVAPSYTKIETKGQFSFSAPSNIALVKYWGKKEQQIPANPSLSFTLKNCKTITTLNYQPNTTDKISFDLLFEGAPKDSFRPKIQSFFERILTYCPYILDYHFNINTQNTFPHSSGIASSASGMAALAANIMALEKLLIAPQPEEYYRNKASF